MNEIVEIMKYMAEQLGKEHGQLFENGFIGHLMIISVSFCTFSWHLLIFYPELEF